MIKELFNKNTQQCAVRIHLWFGGAAVGEMDKYSL